MKTKFELQCSNPEGVNQWSKDAGASKDKSLEKNGLKGAKFENTPEYFKKWANHHEAMAEHHEEELRTGPTDPKEKAFHEEALEMHDKAALNYSKAAKALASGDKAKADFHLGRAERYSVDSKNAKPASSLQASQVAAAEHLCQCEKCSCNFDKSKAKNTDAGCECPNCGTLLDEKGAAKVEDQAAREKAKDGKEIVADDASGDMDAKNAARQPALEASNPEGINQYSNSGAHEQVQGDKGISVKYTKEQSDRIGKHSGMRAEFQGRYERTADHLDSAAKDAAARTDEFAKHDSDKLREAAEHLRAGNRSRAEKTFAKMDTQAREHIVPHIKSTLDHADLYQSLGVRVADKSVNGASASNPPSLQAGYNGNQHQSSKELAAEHSVAADTASKVAASASKAARNQDPSNKEGMHDHAQMMHAAAKSLHELAAQKHRSAGEEDCAKDHDTAAAGHGNEMQAHKGVIEACGGQAAKTAPAAVAALASDATPAAGLQLDCSACVEAKNFKSILNPIADGITMYMPGGTHEITPSQNGRAVTVTVEINAAAAEKLEAQRKLLEASGKKPFFSVQHSTQIAAFWPQEFFWDTRLDATGSLVEGVWARGEWTRAGREAVEGKDFRTFSPTFFVDAIRNDPNRPVQVVCNNEAKANMGALENDPAFQTISPLWAHDASAAGTPKPKPEGVTTERLIVMVHDELRASNPDLQDVVNALSFKYDMRVSSNDVAKALRGEALEAGGPGSGPRPGGGSGEKWTHGGVERHDTKPFEVGTKVKTDSGETGEVSHVHVNDEGFPHGYRVTMKGDDGYTKHLESGHYISHNRLTPI